MGSSTCSCSTGTLGGAADLVGNKAFIAACWRLSTTVGFHPTMSKNAQESCKSCKSCSNEVSLSWSQSGCWEAQGKLQVMSIFANSKPQDLPLALGPRARIHVFLQQLLQLPMAGRRDTKTRPTRPTRPSPWHLQAASWSSWGFASVHLRNPSLDIALQEVSKLPECPTPRKKCGITQKQDRSSLEHERNHSCTNFVAKWANEPFLRLLLLRFLIFVTSQMHRNWQE